MLFRDHPLFTYQNRRSWPPAWLYCGGFDNTHPLGEVGLLKNVFISSVKPSTRCFLIMEHADAEYMGDLLVSDEACCTQICEMLLGHCGKTIQEIGNIHLSNPPQVSDIRSHKLPSSRPVFIPAERRGCPTVQRNHFGATQQRISAVSKTALANATRPKGKRT